MNKSFGYLGDGNYYIARHQIGDFGLHLSLIRSFSWGSNSPQELPFFPGAPLTYHYYFDFLTGLIEKQGVRIDVAFNGLSILAFTLLLYLLYKLPQKIFGKSIFLGLLSVALFLFHSSMTFIDFFKARGISSSLISDIWRLPDYIHRGPFDGSIISILFTFNVFLNQRHLVAALVIALTILYIVLPKLFNKKPIENWKLITLGILLGVSSRLHGLVFFSSTTTLFFLFLLFKRYKEMLYIFVPAVFLFVFHLKDVLSYQAPHAWFNPGFLTEKPLSFAGFLTFWFLNLGIALILIPFAFFKANDKQRKLFFAVLPLFIIGNLVQFSLRIDHNHTLFNFFLIFVNFYIAFFLVSLWKKNLANKFLVCLLFFFLTISGILDLMPIKNDFRYPVQLGVENTFLRWIKNETGKNAVFLSRQEILDPVTLAGRKNFFGHGYYREVLVGYTSNQREALVKSFFEANEMGDFDLMRGEKIQYVVLPKGTVTDFSYKVDSAFFRKNLPVAYEDENVLVFKL